MPETKQPKMKLIENYIYLYHIKKFIVIPTFAETLSDSLGSNFNPSTPLSRSAPIYSYSNSGPRSMQISIPLHRDLMTQINTNVSNYPVKMDEDYVDAIIREIQAIALPAYNGSDKIVDPPQIAVRFGEDVFIKGIVNGGVTVDYQLPILEDGKYAKVSLSFKVDEVIPFDAYTVAEVGSFRGVDTSLERNNYRRVI